MKKSMMENMLMIIALACLMLSVLALTGCSYQTLTGEQGYEWAFRMNPISKREEQQEFKPRVITFGKSSMSYDEVEPK